MLRGLLYPRFWKLETCSRVPIGKPENIRLTSTVHVGNNRLRDNLIYIPRAMPVRGLRFALALGK